MMNHSPGNDLSAAMAIAMDSNQINIFHVYKKYCVITWETSTRANEDNGDPDKHELTRLQLRKSLAYLLKCFQSRVCVRDTVYDEISFLMSSLNLMADEFRDFSLFYNFVFFISLEKDQKCISVSSAVTNWRIVLAGRFRLLNQWCEFVEKNHRHNITEDTWRQVLTFSRLCPDGSIQGYDPEGFWPVLIDDFMEHLSSLDYEDLIQSCQIYYSEGMSLNDNDNDNMKPVKDEEGAIAT